MIVPAKVFGGAQTKISFTFNDKTYLRHSDPFLTTKVTRTFDRVQTGL